MKSRNLSLVFLAAILTAPAAWADTAAIEGTVKDVNGRALSGADIRIEAKDGSTWHKLAKTDAKGHYQYVGLTVGSYRVSLLVNGATKASINNVKTNPGSSTNLNFDLQKGNNSSQASASSKKTHTHKVWIPPTTGSNFGGRWVEVEEGDTTTTSSRVTRTGAGSLGTLQSNSGNAKGGD